MKLFGSRFTFGKIQMINLIFVKNITDNSVTQSVARSLKRTLKHNVTADELRWWLEERSRCLTYVSLFIFKQQIKYGEKVSSPTLELPPDVEDYSWVDDEVQRI